MQLFLRSRAIILVVGFFLLAGREAGASVNLPIHHWVHEAIEQLTALGVIDRALLGPKPYSRKEAAKYVAWALERIRSDQAPADGQEATAELLLEWLIQFLRPELSRLGALPDPSEQFNRAIRYGGRLQVEADAFLVGHGTVRLRETGWGNTTQTASRCRVTCEPGLK